MFSCFSTGCGRGLEGKKKSGGRKGGTDKESKLLGGIYVTSRMSEHVSPLVHCGDLTSEDASVMPS